jgi:chemotaxis regulatin CheY-phosphate phosphatase CheZ
MAEGRSLTTISEADYDAIEAAVMETERGRWFLREYARRNRNSDTQVLLDAISRLEQAVAGDRVAQDVDRLRANLKEMATAIARTKAEIASIHAIEQEHSHLFAASEALDAITRTTEQATSDILAAAEHIQESAWTLREDGANPELCDDLDRRATEIYTACSFQDLTAQRIVKIVQTLRYLEGRINAMIAIWDDTEPGLMPISATPDLDLSTLPGEFDASDLDQSDIDSVIVGEDLFGMGDTTPEDADTPAPARMVEVASFPTRATTEGRVRIDAFAEIDQLPTREKLRLFT